MKRKLKVGDYVWEPAYGRVLQIMKIGTRYSPSAALGKVVTGPEGWSDGTHGMGIKKSVIRTWPLGAWFVSHWSDDSHDTCDGKVTFITSKKLARKLLEWRLSGGSL